MKFKEAKKLVNDFFGPNTLFTGFRWWLFPRQRKQMKKWAEEVKEID